MLTILNYLNRNGVSPWDGLISELITVVKYGNIKTFPLNSCLSSSKHFYTPHN